MDDEVEDKVHVLVIYDICSNSRRTKLSKFLQGFGFRIQRSSFEARISRINYGKMMKNIGKFATNEDSIRIYKLLNGDVITSYGKDVEVVDEDVVII